MPPTAVPGTWKRVTEPSVAPCVKPSTSVSTAPGRRRFFQKQADGVENANGRARPAPARAPTGLGLGTGNGNQRQPHPVRIAEGQDRFAKALVDRVEADAFLQEPVRPVTDRTLRHSEDGLLRLADAEPSRCQCSQGKKVRIVPGAPVSSP